MTGMGRSDSWLRAYVRDMVALGGEGGGRVGQVAAGSEARPSLGVQSGRRHPVWPEPSWAQGTFGLLADSLARSHCGDWISSSVWCALSLK